MIENFLDKIYFQLIIPMKDSHIKLNLMGLIAFTKSFIKHLKRKSPTWMLKKQVEGFIMCLKQLIFERRNDTT